MSAHGDVDLGHTLAGWTGTALAGLGAATAGAGICLDRAWLLWLGAALTAAAAVTTWVLHLAGWGKPSGPRPAHQWDWRVRDTTARAGHPDCLGCRLAGRYAPASAGRLTSYSRSVGASPPRVAARPPVAVNPSRR